ncbi:hypothetical protein Trydic_g2188 [Trypoxylus dichotomus]
MSINLAPKLQWRREKYAPHSEEWFKKFSSEDLSLTGEAESRRSKIINKENLKQAVETNSSATCLELAERFNVSDETIHLRLHQLGKTWKLSKWVPRELSVITN